MRFAPKWNADNFKAPFTAAEGWGSYSQKQSNGVMEYVLEPKYGQVQLSSFSVETPKGRKAKTATVTLGGQTVPAKWKQTGGSVLVSLQNRVTLKAEEQFVITIKNGA
jgi:hypothetical protein